MCGRFSWHLQFVIIFFKPQYNPASLPSNLVLHHVWPWICPNFSFTYIIYPGFSQFSCSVMSDFDPMDCSTPGFPVHHQLLEFAQTHVHWVDDAIQLSHSLSSPSPSAFNLSQHQGLFWWVSSLHQVASQSISFSISSSNEYSGLISFRTDWFDLLAVQGTLKSLLQHHSSMF